MCYANLRLLHFVKLWTFLPALTLILCGNRGNNTGGIGSTSVSGELDVYGLKPN